MELFAVTIVCSPKEKKNLITMVKHRSLLESLQSVHYLCYLLYITV